MPNIRADLTEADRANTSLAGPDYAGPDFASASFVRSGPSTDWRATPLVSDEECLALLAKAVENHNPEALDEVAWLIGRLAVPIE